MQFTGGFLRKSASGKWVGVLKYRDPDGQWRQVTKTFTRDRGEAERLLVEWRGRMAGEQAPAWRQKRPTDGAPLPGDRREWREWRESGPPLPGGQLERQAGEAPLPGDRRMRRERESLLPGQLDWWERESPLAGPTVEEAVRACLTAQLTRGRIERSTHDTQLAYATRELFPQLGAVPLAQLTAADVQAWLDRLCLSISPGSARIPFSTLSKTCSRAVREGIIARNPLDTVEQPTRTRPARTYLPASSVELLERALGERWGAGHPYTCAARLALHAGLRAGETCGLRWWDVELGAGRLRVTTSIGRSSGGCYVKGPKNPSSARDFPIVSELAQQLRTRRAEVCRAAGAEPDGSWFVCGARDEPSSPHALSVAFAKLCDEAGVTDSSGRRATFHTLRHTFATRAVRAGVDVRTLADLLGHARADVTLNVYAASSEDAKLMAASRLEEAFSRN